jgi:DNA invertase Pin-like site-specific DNA recombinase
MVMSKESITSTPRVTWGYARVSGRDQELSRQLLSLAEYGVKEERIICDKQSGKDFQRPGWLTLKGQLLRAGDILVVKELDRIGRDYDLIKQEWSELRAANIEIVVIDTPILSTADKSDLEKSLISSIVFELLAYLSEKTRIKIKSSQAEGIRAAKKNNVKFGRPAAVAPAGFDIEVAKWRNGDQTAVETFTKLGLSKTTFYKLVGKMGV